MTESCKTNKNKNKSNVWLEARVGLAANLLQMHPTLVAGRQRLQQVAWSIIELPFKSSLGLRLVRTTQSKLSGAWLPLKVGIK